MNIGPFYNVYWSSLYNNEEWTGILSFKLFIDGIRNSNVIIFDPTSRLTIAGRAARHSDLRLAFFVRLSGIEIWRDSLHCFKIRSFFSFCLHIFLLSFIFCTTSNYRNSLPFLSNRNTFIKIILLKMYIKVLSQ